MEKVTFTGPIIRDSNFMSIEQIRKFLDLIVDTNYLMQKKKNIMKQTEHLNKIAEIVKDIRTCMFTTQSESGGLRARPMATAQYDETGEIWFFTDKDSAKIDELENQQPVMLSYAKPSDNTYLSITGVATTSNDLDKKKEIFSSISKAWFPEGPESKDLSLIRFKPTQAEYWDSSDSNIVQLYRIGKAVIAGEEYEAKPNEHSKVNM